MGRCYYSTNATTARTAESVVDRWAGGVARLGGRGDADWFAGNGPATRCRADTDQSPAENARLARPGAADRGSQVRPGSRHARAERPGALWIGVAAHRGACARIVAIAETRRRDGRALAAAGLLPVSRVVQYA